MDKIDRFRIRLSVEIAGQIRLPLTIEGHAGGFGADVQLPIVPMLPADVSSVPTPTRLYVDEVWVEQAPILEHAQLLRDLDQTRRELETQRRVSAECREAHATAVDERAQLQGEYDLIAAELAALRRAIAANVPRDDDRR